MQNGNFATLPSTLVVPAVFVVLTLLGGAVVWGAGELVTHFFAASAGVEATAGIGAVTVASLFAGSWFGPISELLVS